MHLTDEKGYNRVIIEGFSDEELNDMNYFIAVDDEP